MDSQQDKIREEIVRAASEVFKRYGYTKVTMHDISKASGKGRSTLYYYFRNKMEVFDAMSQAIFKNLLIEIQKIIKPELPFAENLGNYYTHKLKNLKKVISEYELVAEDFRKDPSLIVMKTRSLLESEMSVINNMIQWALANKEIAPLTTEDSRFLAEVFVTAFKSFEQEVVLFNKLQNFESKISWLVQILKKGLT